MGLLYSSCVKKNGLSAGTIIAKEKEESNNGALLGALLFGCIKRFLLLYIIWASVPNKRNLKNAECLAKDRKISTIL